MNRKAMADEILWRYGRLRRRFPWVFRRPLGFFFYLTASCNLNCRFCWQREDERRKENWADAADGELAPEEWVRTVASLPRPCFLGLSGGEASLSRAYEPVLAEAQRRKIPVTVNSNGAALEPAKIEALFRYGVRNLSISLDGFEGAHDPGRGRDGHFQRVTGALKEFRRLRAGGSQPQLTIKTVVLDENFRTLPEFRAFCEKDLGADALNLSLAKVGDHAQFSLKYEEEASAVFRAEGARLHPYREPEALAEVLASLLEPRPAGRTPVLLFPRMLRPAQVRRYLQSGGSRAGHSCSMPRALSVVLPDGTLIPCLSVAVGSLREHDFDIRPILRGRRLEHFARTIENFGAGLPAACTACCFLKVAP